MHEDINLTFPEGKQVPKVSVREAIQNQGYLDPPSWEAIQLAFPEGKQIQRKKFPLNIKRVQQACLINTEQLTSFDRECHSFFKEHTRIARDEEIYDIGM